MANLQNKVIAITGGASGIVLAVAKQCAAFGASLALADIQEIPLKQVEATLTADGVDVMATKVDVSHSGEVTAWVGAIMNRFGRLHGAANLTGVESNRAGVFANLEDLDDSVWNLIMSINLTGLFFCLRAQLKAMEAGASIVNAASIAGLIGRPGLDAYSVSKHGVVGLTKTAAKEAGEKGIRINAVAPGPIHTPMLSRIIAAGGKDRAVTNSYATLPLKRLGTAEEVAKTFVFLVSDNSSFTTGSVYTVDRSLCC
ncbi:oxidoreductase, short chain dehydrogenase/reductase [Metarhizium guizhouense ARSEF 977]|uniref:Hydroxynaphthalene reductase-like protein Arp2 n=1 Tax=Metarhizium guizhouense (strain ARSEF 977) TaxID=1276136 RepID=A0A0B4GG99_METGA|nr:oxidoreductase, short chain dehydrogenase/reductase [Metarhizium guizhouense ARSEF 977]